MSFNTGTAASGAASGATAGSAFGPWGVAIGAVVGGVAGGFIGGQQAKYTEDPYARELSGLAQRDWATWEARYRPMQQQLAGRGAAMLEASPTSGLSKIDASFDRQVGARDRAFASYGLQATADQKEASDRSTDLARGLAKVGIGNARAAASRRIGMAALEGF